MHLLDDSCDVEFVLASDLLPGLLLLSEQVQSHFTEEASTVGDLEESFVEALQSRCHLFFLCADDAAKFIRVVLLPTPLPKLFVEFGDFLNELIILADFPVLLLNHQFQFLDALLVFVPIELLLQSGDLVLVGGQQVTGGGEDVAEHYYHTFIVYRIIPLGFLLAA